ncbi:MAG: 5-oxoprolinase subunit PxpB [Betaproteobacteria bacterium]|nr:5-oxoprolinase subunit PxpB [Betaproteobacteria bacterium]
MTFIGWRGRGSGKPRIVPLGDGALLVEFSSEVDMAVNAQLQRVAAALRARCPPWVRDIIPAIGGLAVHFDAAAVVGSDLKSANEAIAKAREELRALIEDCVAAARGKSSEADSPAIELPVCYGGEFGVDLDAVAKACGMRSDEVVRRHAKAEHRVLMVGFAPGHPYIGGSDPKLSVPRRATPRTRVPEGSVAIANGQTAVYPFAISGGWNLIGRTPLRVFDALHTPPALFAPGQRVRFIPIERGEFDRLRPDSR